MRIQGMQGYNASETATLGESNKLKAGNYICKILGVKVESSKSGRPMLVVQFDIAEGEFMDYYTELYRVQKEKNLETKYRGVYYQLMDGSSLPFYKGFLSAIEKSNDIKLDGENGFDSSMLVGKLFGGSFAEEEYEYNGEVREVTKLMIVTDIDNLKNVQAKRKTLNNNANSKNTNSSGGSDEYYSVEQGVSDDDLPF